jgi:asparagine synthetase B (glutamine-hydrolysing)
MCGIVGLANLASREPVDRGVLERMTKPLAHRGPDDEGLFLDGPGGLGHRRLSIVDLSADGMLRVRGGPKHLLKQAVRGLIPDRIIDRPKQGFAAPICEWLRGPTGAPLLSRLARSGLWDIGCFDVSHVRSLIETHVDGRRDLSTRLWCLLNLAFWYDDWIGGRGAFEGGS